MVSGQVEALVRGTMADERGLILVVDDNRLNRLKLSMGLEQQGHKVSLAEDGQQALDLLQAGSFDVVLLDIVMPGMDGFQVLQQIKNDHNLRDIPVIVISALDEVDSAVRCIEMGAEDYLPKPFNSVLLRARLNSSLQKKKLRDLEKMYLQQELTLRRNEKLATLGKLSAGMAHELNNPAAAVQRGAAQLESALSRLQHAHLKLCQLDLSAAQLESLLGLDKVARERAGASSYLDAITRSDRESELEQWLIDSGVKAAWEIAPTLVGLSYTLAELESIAADMSEAQFAAAIDWLTRGSVIYSLVQEIALGSGRISEIVRALKAYTYLDQAPIQTVDLREGLENTLIILRGKLRAGVTVRRDYGADVPRIEAYGSELNQVWTNLIDNAIDAMDGSGEITIRTRSDGQWAVVEIEDNGPGIPDSIQPNIFDPFFTTKPPGSGTGLGLNISHNIVVQKHGGRIAVLSQPGRTCFEIRLPAYPPKRE